MGWHYSKDKDTEFDHILLYKVCTECNERSMGYDDPTTHGKDYAIAGNDSVAKARTFWIEAGMIKTTKKIDFLDKSYAPAAGIEQLIASFKKDKEFSALIEDHKMVDDALGQLEVAVKLCVNNKKKKP